MNAFLLKLTARALKDMGCKESSWFWDARGVTIGVPEEFVRRAALFLDDESAWVVTGGVYTTKGLGEMVTVKPL